MKPLRRPVLLTLLPLLAGPGARAQSPAPVEHVVHVSVDGLRGDLLRDLLAGDEAGRYAGFRRFVDEGATTFEARSDATHTNTMPNHASMLTGRPVLQPPGWSDDAHHGFDSNGMEAPDETLHSAGNPRLAYAASVFDVVHDHGRPTAFFTGKPKLRLFDRSWDADFGATDTVGADDGRDKIDVFVLRVGLSLLGATSQGMHHEFLFRLRRDRFHYTFVHYLDPDSSGHVYGWESEQYARAVARVAEHLGELLALVEDEPALRGRTVVLVSSDHGGTGDSHRIDHEPRNYTIPFLAWGAGVAAGADLYQLNAATRAHPGTGQPGYDAPLQPIRNADGANLALALLGLGPVPGSSINARQDLRLDRPAVLADVTGSRLHEGAGSGR